MANKALPIYDGHAHSLPKLSEGNAGLHFARFYDGYFAEDEDSAKSTFLKKFAITVGNKAVLNQHALRQQSLAKACHGEAQVYALSGHFVTGMGNAHPVENGFHWHHTLGVPYLSGSQVKGMMRSMIERYFAGSKEDKRTLLKQWFGSNTKNPLDPEYDAVAGELIFFDALPLQPPVMTVDVMTPHMGDWYAQGNKIKDLRDSDKIPADWHDPIPVPFLSVKDAQFVFSIGKRTNSSIDKRANRDINLAEVWKVLDNALQYLGAGGKTNTGFGYMQKDKRRTAELHAEAQKQQEARQQAAEFAQAQANASEFHVALLQHVKEEDWQANNDTAKTRFTDALRNEWLEKLEANPNEHESIALFIEIAKQHYPTQMKNPQHKKVKPQQREWILRLLALQTQ